MFRKIPIEKVLNSKRVIISLLRMQFQVPQFTDVEDKIFGPLTLKQFVYVAGGGGLAFLIWRLLPPFIAFPLALAVIGFSASLAFIKINKKPLIVVLEAGFMYFVNSKLYLWDTDYKKKNLTAKKLQLPSSSAQEVPSLSENKLTNLAWSLDINERIRLDGK
ncbi:hypothetical protein COB80_01560 [Candidatus Kaiserbacteria bacterium]|nr:MAG: hypothetical protein COB80_01560 [Candidatus Kaiserbacteria bacterium]